MEIAQVMAEQIMVEESGMNIIHTVQLNDTRFYSYSNHIYVTKCTCIIPKQPSFQWQQHT